MPVFNNYDRALIEAIPYQPDARPNFEFMRSCLVWPDEGPDGITPDGYANLCDLWLVRSFIYRGKPESEWYLHNPASTRLRDLWRAALEEQVKWNGFRRLELSAEDHTYYMSMLEDMRNSPSI